MNVLIDIGHPAHVHYFKNLYSDLKERHAIIVTCRNSEIIKNLLNYHNIDFICLGDKGNNTMDKIMKQIVYTKKIKTLFNKHRINLAIGASPLVVHGAMGSKVRSIMFDDDDQKVQPYTARFVSPFANTILSPDSLKFEKLENAVYYPGFHELAYLHPKRFTPDSSILDRYRINKDHPYFVLRFNAFKAHHDVSEKGMSLNQKRALIRLLGKHGLVYITTEAKLDSEFEKFRLPIEPQEIHSFLAYSAMLVSDSQTMTSEAAMLGVPSFRCNSFVGRISSLEEEEKRYGLTKGFLPEQFNWMLESISRLMEEQRDRDYWLARRNDMMKDKIDVTGFWEWFIENYPESTNQLSQRGFSFDIFK